MNEKFVICEICWQKFGQITVSHLKKHYISIKEYKLKFSYAKLRKELSFESREKMRKAKIGKIRSEEAKLKQSVSLKRTMGTSEFRKKRSLITEKSWKNPECRQNHIKGLSLVKEQRGKIEKQKWENPEYKQRMKQKHKERWAKDEERMKQSKRRKVWFSVPENIQKWSIMCNTDKRKKQLSESTKKLANQGKLWVQSPIGKKRRKEVATIQMKKQWANPEFKEKTVKAVLKACKTSPNKVELQLQSLLNDLYPNEFKYVGDGEVIIAGKCPDFININGKKQIIELYGDYWHKGQKEEDRVKIFEPYGYKTLIVWEKELKDVDRVKEKIKRFVAE